MVDTCISIILLKGLPLCRFSSALKTWWCPQTGSRLTHTRNIDQAASLSQSLSIAAFSFFFLPPSSFSETLRSKKNLDTGKRQVSAECVRNKETQTKVVTPRTHWWWAQKIPESKSLTSLREGKCKTPTKHPTSYPRKRN